MIFAEVLPVSGKYLLKDLISDGVFNSEIYLGRKITGYLSDKSRTQCHTDHENKGGHQFSGLVSRYDIDKILRNKTAYKRKGRSR